MVENKIPEHKKMMILYRGEASNANGIRIIYYIPDIDLDGWSAKFTIQNVNKSYPTITNNYIEVILTGEETKSLELGICYGWMQIIDGNGEKATLHAQTFLVKESGERF